MDGGRAPVRAVWSDVNRPGLVNAKPLAVVQWWPANHDPPRCPANPEMAGSHFFFKR